MCRVQGGVLMQVNGPPLAEVLEKERMRSSWLCTAVVLGLALEQQV
jgi:hypothetical protein